MSIRSLDKLLKPQRIAVVGASDQPGKVGYTLLQNMVGRGYVITALKTERGDVLWYDPLAYDDFEAALRAYEALEKYSVDLTAAARDKIVLNAKKYPVEKARGSARKYTDL